MTKPSQLERQAAEVAQIEADIAAAREAEANPPDSDPPIDTPPSEPVPPAPVVQPPAPPVQTSEWETRYRTLEGKYRAEVPRLTSQVNALQQKLDEALASIAKLKTPVAPATLPTPLVTDKDRETFGEDLIDLVTRKASEMLAAQDVKTQEELDKVRKENEQLRTQFGTVAESQAANATSVYLEQLTKLVPDWETLNTDAAFLTWLQTVDTMSGLTRQAYVDNAFAALDAKRTAVIFETYKAQVTPVVPVVPKPTVPNPAVQRQIEPGKTKSSAPVTPDAGSKIWPVTEIEQFYADVRAKKIDEPDRVRMEAEIDRAVAEGRIR